MAHIAVLRRIAAVPYMASCADLSAAALLVDTRWKRSGSSDQTPQPRESGGGLHNIDRQAILRAAVH